MKDRFKNTADVPFGPSTNPFSITPHDSDPLPEIVNGIYVGGGGDVTLRCKDSDQDVTYRNLTDGAYINVRATHVRDTGTSATDLIGEA